MSKRKLNDEKILAALMAHGSVRAAAEAAKVSESVIYDRLRDREFMRLYDRARDDLLRGCVNRLADRTVEAVDVIAGIMTDGDVNPAIRVQAARQILEYSGRMADRMHERETVIRTEDPPETPLDALSRALMEDWAQLDVNKEAQFIRELEAGRDTGL